MKDKQNYLASLKSQLASVQAQAAADAQAQLRRSQAKADAQAAQEAEIQRAYAEALTTYQNETLPQYQKELGELNAAYIKAQGEYNQADNNYQMAFAQWQADQSDENAQALDEAENTRSQAEINCQEAKEAYEDKKGGSAENAGIFGLQQCRRGRFCYRRNTGRWTGSDRPGKCIRCFHRCICGYFRN
mgnify:CR=1 FL=1